MPRGILITEAGPVSAERDAEFNEWYSNTHIPEILQIPGFVGARRYRVHEGGPLPDTGRHRYLAIYELEADDLGAPVAELRERRAAGKMTTSDALGVDPPPVLAIYELIDEHRPS